MPPHRVPEKLPRGPGLIGLLLRGLLLLTGVTVFKEITRGRARRRTERSTSASVGRGGHGTPPSAAAAGAGHETEDMSGPLMARLFGGLAFTVVGVIGLMLAYVQFIQPAAPPLTPEQTATIQPPSPNLQAAPLQEIAGLHRREEALLDNYAWIDPEHTRARIPVSRAMTLVVGQSLDAAPLPESPR